MVSFDLIAGLDLGQQIDYSVLSILYNNYRNNTYDIIYLKRYPIKTSYVSLVEDIGGLVSASSILKDAIIIVDATGVGRPVIDMFSRISIDVIAATITGGTTCSWKSRAEVSVSKKEIVSSIQVALQNKKIKISSDTSIIEEYKKEMLNFKSSISKRAHTSFNAAQGHHDDIVMSLGLSIWLMDDLTKRKNKVRIITGS